MFCKSLVAFNDLQGMCFLLSTLSQARTFPEGDLLLQTAICSPSTERGKL
jgi:hypothetical protein